MSFLQLESQCEQLQLKVRTLQLDWETEQKRSVSYFNQVMELEKERDQVSEMCENHGSFIGADVAECHLFVCENIKDRRVNIR